jgi:NAD(P)-dependent dehydrogenase (short-subunit alcohol dehydrogenase family)
LPNIPSGGSILFTASINPLVGHPELVDYTAAKGAIVGFARALSNQIVGKKGIRVNGTSPYCLMLDYFAKEVFSAVAPGPIWTPLMCVEVEHTHIYSHRVYDSPSTMTDENKKTFGTKTPMGRAGQPIEVATSFVFLASADSSYMRSV